MLQNVSYMIQQPKKQLKMFKYSKTRQEASDPDGYLRYKLTTIAGQEFVSNHKKEVEHDLGIKKYGDIIEIVFSKNLMETVQFIDFILKITDAQLDLKGDALKQLKEREKVFYAIRKILIMKKNVMLKINKIILIAVFLFSSCQKKLDAYYFDFLGDDKLDTLIIKDNGKPYIQDIFLLKNNQQKK